MYNYKGINYTIDQINQAAEESNLSFDDYMKKLKESDPDPKQKISDADLLDPTTFQTGAPAGVGVAPDLTATPKDTDLVSEDISLESQEKIDIPTSKDIKYKTPLTVNQKSKLPYRVAQQLIKENNFTLERVKEVDPTYKQADITFKEIQENIKNFPQEEIDKTFYDLYFKLDDIPVISQERGGRLEDFRVTKTFMPIEQYLGKEKYEQYLQIERGEEIKPYSIENAKQITKIKQFEAPNKAKDKYLKLYLRNVPEDVQEKIEIKYAKNYPSLEDANYSLDWYSNEVEKNIENYNNSYDTYLKNMKPTLDRLDVIKNTISEITEGTMKPSKKLSEEQLNNFKNLATEYNNLYEKYKAGDFGDYIDGLNKQKDLINFNIEELKNKSQDLNNREIIEKAIGLDYSFSTRLSMAMEDFFVKGAINTGSLSSQLLLTAKKYVSNPNFYPIFDKAINTIKENTINYNARLAEKRETTVPEALKLEDIGKAGVGIFDWVNEAFAENGPSIATTVIPGGAALTANRNLMLAGMRTAQGIFFATETGSKYGDLELEEKNAKEKIILLKAELSKTEDLNRKLEIQEDINHLEKISNYSFAQKAFTSYAYGGTATFFESIGSLKFVQGTSKLAKDFGKQQFKKEFYEKGFNFTKNTVGKTLSGLPKLAFDATAVNTIEETLTLGGQNAFDIIVLDENKSIFDGIDKDFFANNIVATFGMFSPRAGGNIVNIIKNEFKTKSEVDNVNKRVIELVNLRESIPNLSGRELQEAKVRKNELIEQLALDDALSYQKLTALNQNQILEAADLSRQMRQVLKRAQTIGAVGDLSKSGKKSRKDLEDQYVALNKRRTEILNTKKSKINEDVKKLQEELGGEFVNTNPAYYFGLYDFYTDAAKVMMPKNGEYIVVDDINNIEELLSKYNEQTISEIKQKFEGSETEAPVNAANIGNDIIINEKQIKENIAFSTGFADGKYSAVAPLEELFHIYNKSKNIVDKDGNLSEEANKAVDEVINTLNDKKELGRINEREYNALIERFKLYKKSGKGKVVLNSGKRGAAGVDAEEIIAQLNNAVALGVLDISDVGNMPSIRSFINNITNETFGDFSWSFQLNTADDVYKFIKNYQTKVEDRTAISPAKEDEEIVKASRSQEASDRVQKIYEDKGEAGAFEIIQEFKPIVDKIVERRRGAPNFDKQLLTDEIETGNRGLFDLIREYKPESNVPLAAFINRFLPARAIEASRRVLGEEFTADVTERVDIAAEETAVETVDEKAEARKIKPSSFISKDAVEKIKEQVSERIKDVPADKLTFKRLGDLAPEIIAEEIGIPVKKLTVPAANLSKGDASAIQRFITKNADKLLKILPEGAVTEAASEKLLGTSTGVAKGLLNAFYDKQARGTKGAGLSPFTLKKDISRADFLKAFGIVEGKKAEGFSARSSEAQALKGVASLYGRLVTNEIVRSEIDLAPEVAQDIAAGKARVMFSNSKLVKGNKTLSTSDADFRKPKDINEARAGIVNSISPILSAEEFINIFLGTSKRAYTQGKIIDEEIKDDKKQRIVRFKEDGGRFSTRYFLFLNTKDFRKTLVNAYPDIDFEFGSGFVIINGKKIITTSPKQSPQGIINGDFENGRGTNTMPSLQERQNFAIQQKESMRKVVDVMKEKFSSGDLTVNQVAMILQNFNSSVDALIRTAAVPSIFTSEETIKLVEQKLKRKLTDKDFLYEHSQTASDTLLELSKIITNEPEAYTFDEIMDGFKVAIIPKVYTKLIDARIKDGGAGLRSDGRRDNDGNLILNEGTNITRYDDAADIFAREGLPKLVLNEIKPNEIKASQKTANINNKELPSKFKKSKSANNNQVLNTMQELDKKADEARVNFSKAFDLNKDFNKIIENKTGIAAEDVYSKSLAQVKGAGKGKYNFFIPPSAEDFVGLLYTTLGKGKLGDQQMAWYKTHLLNPFARGIENISRERVTLMNDFVALKKQLKVVPKNLRKKLGDTGFTREQGVRVYVWSKQGMEIPETNKSDIDAILKEFNKFEDLKLFGDQLVSINKGDGYPAPENSWTSGTITTDLLNGLNTTKRQKHLEQWQENVDIIFSKENLNKLQAAYGENYVAALKGHLERMKSGRNRKLSPDKLTSRFNDWVNGSVGAIMFFNARSAVLQTISAINFINFTDNNPLKAGLAFANQKQYWADFKMLFNSDFLVERRDGAKLTVQEADIADMAKGKGARGVISGLLKFGFLPTQLADSFAIASGGATFYRNRLNTYLNEKNEEGENVYTEKQAKELAFRDFREISEESQQSSRPDKISQQQAGPLGRVILAFANTSAQYTRIIKKAALDLKNRRGDDKTNISKIIYYGVIQNVVFNALQQAVFALAFGDEDDEELTSEKYVNTANGMVDSILRGIGIGGAIVSTGKNAILRIIRENEKDRPNYERVADEFLKISPPVSSKYSKIVQAARSYTWNKKEMKEKGFSLDNPAYLANAKVISSLTNIPLDRAIKKIENIENAVYADIEPWQRAALLAGWSDWQLDIKKDKEKADTEKSIRKVKVKKVKVKKVKAK